MTDLYIDEEYVGLLNLWFRQQTEITDLVGQRIHSNQLPSNKVYPCILVSHLVATSVHGVGGWIRKPLLQIDAWTQGDVHTCYQIIGTARALVEQRLPRILSANNQSIVINDKRVGGVRRGFDPVNTALAKCSFDVDLTVHPNPHS